MTYKDDLKTKIIEKLLLKSNVLTVLSGSPSDDKILSEKAVATELAKKENIGKITIGSTEYTVVKTTTDAGEVGKIVFVVE